jgi:hypothetical protein
MKEYVVYKGNIAEVLPLSKQLYEALRAQGMDHVHACFWILRGSIILGGGDPKYDRVRHMMEKILLKGGEKS